MSMISMDRETRHKKNRQTYRQTKQTDRQIADRQTDSGQTDRQIDSGHTSIIQLDTDGPTYLLATAEYCAMFLSTSADVSRMVFVSGDSSSSQQRNKFKTC